MTRIAAGDAGAFRVLVTAHGPSLLRYLRASTPTESTAEEVMQETLLAIWRGAGSFRGDGSVAGWMFGLARRQAARATRRHVGEPFDPEPLHLLGEQAGFGRDTDPEALACALEDRERLWRALRTLSDADREVVVLADLEELPAPEVAQILEISLSAVKSRLHRARLRLLAAVDPTTSEVPREHTP